MDFRKIPSVSPEKAERNARVAAPILILVLFALLAGWFKMDSSPQKDPHPPQIITQP